MLHAADQHKPAERIEPGTAKNGTSSCDPGAPAVHSKHHSCQIHAQKDQKCIHFLQMIRRKQHRQQIHRISHSIIIQRPKQIKSLPDGKIHHRKRKIPMQHLQNATAKIRQHCKMLCHTVCHPDKRNIFFLKNPKYQ